MKHLVLIAIFISIELVLAAFWVSAQSGITTFQVSQDFVNSVNAKLTSLQTQITAIPAQLFPTSATNGGTGVASPTVHSIPIAEGTNAFNLVTLATDQFLVGITGADPAPSTIPTCASDNAHAEVWNNHVWNCVSINGGSVQLCSINAATSGTAVCNQVLTGAIKHTTCVLNAYYNSTSTADTCSLAANGGTAFTNAGNIVSNVSPFAATLSGSPPNIIKFPISMQAPISGVLIVEGQ